MKNLPDNIESTVKPDTVIDIRTPARKPVNLNPIVNAMADAQGFEPGSWNWMLAGPAAFAGSSGAQSSYGWRHSHKLTPNYIRAVLANYGHRRCYYRHAPYRQFGYAAAGRPHGWAPEAPDEVADGSTIYLTSRGDVEVTGPDAEHLWLTPLFELVDDPNPIEIDTGLGRKMPSNVVAKFMATLLVSSAVGMVRDKDGDGKQPYPWTYGDRATGRLLHTMVEGFKRGCMLEEDYATAALYIRDIVLAYYEKAPGIHTFGTWWRGNRFPMGLYNGLHWIVPVCYDAAQILRKHGLAPWADRYDALVARWSQWMIDMNEVLPVEFARADRVFLGPGIQQDGGPVDSLKGIVWPEDFHTTFDFRSWSFRAVDIAAMVTDDKGLAFARDEIAKAFEDNDGERSWLVDAAGHYVNER